MNAAMRHISRIGLTMLPLWATSTTLAAQEITEHKTAVTAELTTSKRWSWQCEPIRCTLNVINRGAEAHIRIQDGNNNQPLYPFVLEREHDGAWQPVQPLKQKRRSHPARMLISTGGKTLAPDETLSFEADLWDLDAVSQPGRIRIRFAVDAKAAEPKGAPWNPAKTPWLNLEILPHEANATHLLGPDAADLRSQYDKMSEGLNWTIRTSMNFGPFNQGPAGPFGQAPAKFIRHTATARQLLAIEELSPQLRARARLVAAYSQIEEAQRCPPNDVEDLLVAATRELNAPEVTASPPSGGLAPLPTGGLQALRSMLAAHIAIRMGDESPQEARERLTKQYPWFTYWWSHEMRELLQL